MNIAVIQEKFIRAAEIDRAIPEHVGPQPPRSIDLGYVHDWTDKMCWRKERGDKLTEDPLSEEQRLFWERVGLKPSARELSELEILRAWLLAVPDEAERRALLAWARAKAGGKTFKKWCFKVEGIHPMTGRRRKDRAIERISAYLASNSSQHSENHGLGVLPVTPEISDIPATVEDDAPTEKHALSWMHDQAFQPFIINGRSARHSHRVENPGDFSWAAKRNEMRRQREARKRKEKAKREAA